MTEKFEEALRLPEGAAAFRLLKYRKTARRLYMLRKNSISNAL
jgi:hypothetical protein